MVFIFYACYLYGVFLCTKSSAVPVLLESEAEAALVGSKPKEVSHRGE